MKKVIIFVIVGIIFGIGCAALYSILHGKESRSVPVENETEKALNKLGYTGTRSIPIEVTVKQHTERTVQ